MGTKTINYPPNKINADVFCPKNLKTNYSFLNKLGMVADGRRHSNFKNYRKILGANTLAIMHIIYTGSHFITCFWVESCINIRVHTLEILFIFFTAP